MPSGLSRIQKAGCFHFITFSCYHRLPLLARPGAYSIFEYELERVRKQYQFVIAGYVLMPEHVHLLVGEPKIFSLATALQILKQRSSKLLKRPGETPVLANTLLRLQCQKPGEENRKTPLHAPQSSEARTSDMPGRLALVQLPSLCNRSRRNY